MLNVVKLALRITHSHLDNEIMDLIEAARQDLILSGISNVKANDDTDSLIKRAVIVYVKANFIAENKTAERFQRSYDLLKNHLTLAGDYIE